MTLEQRKAKGLFMLRIMKHRVLSLTAHKIICWGEKGIKKSWRNSVEMEVLAKGSSVPQRLGEWDRRWKSTTATSPKWVSGHMIALYFSHIVDILQASQVFEDRLNDLEL